MLLIGNLKKHIFYIACTLTCVLLSFSCSNNKKENNGIVNKVIPSTDIDEILKDTNHVNPLVDSLRISFYNSTDSSRIYILSELSENWREFAYPLAQEVLIQSKKQNNIYGEGLAYCKMGIFYYRNAMLDSANFFLDKANQLAQNNKLDKIKVEALGWKGEVLRNSGDPEAGINLQNTALDLALSINYQKGAALCYMSQGEAYRYLTKYDKAIECYNKCILMAQQVNDSYKIIICNNGLGDLNRVQGNYVKSLEYFNKSLELAKQTGYKRPYAYCLKTIGDIYNAQNEFKKALEYFKEAEAIAIEIGDKQRISNIYNSMGQIYLNLDDKTKALEYFNKSLKISEEIGNTAELTVSLGHIADIHFYNKDIKEALEYYEKAYAISVETDDLFQQCALLLSYGSCYYELKDYSKAKNYTQQSFNIAKETHLKDYLKEGAFLLYRINSVQNNSREALDMLSLYIETKDSIGNEEEVKKFAAVEYQAKEQSLKAEQKAKEETYKAEQARKEEELKRQKTIRYAFTIGFVLVLVLVVVVYRNLRENKRKNKIIVEQKKEVEHAKELVEEKHKEITDSINYAERIQRTFLATKEILNENLQDYFVYFQPKDVVSGDFYWSGKLQDGNFILATADSTGHGVPGAIMSLLNITSLEKASEHNTEPAEILNHTRKTIIERLKKDGSIDGGKDGMDCSLISFDFKNKIIKYATANNPIWIVQENGTKLLELAPDKMPVGKHDKDYIPFTQNTVQLQKGDVVYTLTDGLPDQFGGPKGKKFMYKQLKGLLLSISMLPMREQQERLEFILNTWKGNLEQVDDITLIGIRV
ncbi:MAG: tetratricopeptide repeat protein [Bacteroidota bacterium]|nr:tetratricopeptide repeat protein [Bacteroidota bacterium]